MLSNRSVPPRVSVSSLVPEAVSIRQAAIAPSAQGSRTTFVQRSSFSRQQEARSQQLSKDYLINAFDLGRIL